MTNETDNRFPDNTDEFRIQQVQLARRRELARSLIDKGLQSKGEMVSGFYVPKNPWQNFAEAASGSYMDSSANAESKDLAARQSAQNNELLSSIPASGPERVQAQIRAMQNPSLRDVIRAQMGVDEHEAARLEKSEQEAANRVEKAEEAERVRVERGEQLAQDRVSRSDDLRYRMTTPNINVHVAGSKPAKPPVGYRWSEDGTELEAIPGGPKDASKAPPPKLTAAQQKAYDDSDVLLGHIDNALEAINTNPDALGKKTIIPDLALGHIDPEGVMTRAAVAGLSAEKVHQLSGAAVSPAEFGRLRPYLPSSGDSAKVAKDKLTNLRKEVERIKAAHARGPTRAVVDPAPAAPAPTEPLTVVRTGTRNGVKVQQMSDGSIREVK